MAQQKIKSHSGAKKRLRKVGAGKLKRRNAFKSHLASSKSTKRKRHLRHAGYVVDADLKSTLRMLPHL